MFWVTWAFKNLVVNKKRTLGTMALITGVLLIVVLSLMFLEGTNVQMKESVRNNRGDLNSVARGIDLNVLPVYHDLNKNYAHLIEDNIRIFRKTAQFIGTSGYSAGTVIGIDPSFIKYLNKNVGWQGKAVKRLSRGTAFIEAAFAEKLDVKPGDYFTIQIRTEAGMINTIQLEIGGVFIGSNLIYSDTVYIHIKDSNLLFMEENAENEVRTFFKKNTTADEIISILKDASNKFYKIALFESPRLDPTKDSVFSIFGYYRYLLVFIFYMLIIVFIIILYFSIQNLFFMNFRTRKQELSTLLTYGMRPSRIKRIVFWEVLFLFTGSLVVTSLLAFILISIISQFTITNPNIGDLIVAIGGPRLYFSFDFHTIFITVALLFLITIYSANKGASLYLKMEVREIIASV